MQIAYAIADGVNSDVKDALGGIEADMTQEYEKLDSDVLADALAKFGEDDIESKVLYVNPLQLAELRKNSAWVNVTDVGVGALRSGVIGNIWGADVVDSNLVPVDEAYIVKKGFVTFFTKRDIQLETGRVQERGSWLMTGNRHGIVAVTDKSKAIKLTKKGA